MYIKLSTIMTLYSYKFYTIMMQAYMHNHTDTFIHSDVRCLSEVKYILHLMHVSVLMIITLSDIIILRCWV